MTSGEVHMDTLVSSTIGYWSDKWQNSDNRNIFHLQQNFNYSTFAKKLKLHLIKKILPISAKQVICCDLF